MVPRIEDGGHRADGGAGGASPSAGLGAEGGRRSRTSPGSAPSALVFVGLAAVALAVHPTGISGQAAGDSPRASLDTLDFRHARHRGVACVACHASEETHGGLTVTRREDCLQCHHREAEGLACTACHAERDLRGGISVTRRLELSTGITGPRPVGFTHPEHESVACEECHAGGAELSAGDVSCADCHEDHHRLEARCAACHADPPDDAHPVEVAHVTCGGSGCHTSMPFERVPRSNQACLSCHQDMADHRPGRPCVECHAMPTREPARGAAGATGGAP